MSAYNVDSRQELSSHRADLESLRKLSSQGIHTAREPNRTKEASRQPLSQRRAANIDDLKDLRVESWREVLVGLHEVGK